MTKNIFIGLLFLICQLTYGQTYYNPRCKSQAETNLKITKIERGDYFMTIDFEFVRTEEKAVYIFLNPSNSDGAYYIKANGKTYKLLSTTGIGNANGITVAHQNMPVNFSAKFEAIPKNINLFDLIEGKTGSWHFYGIQLSGSTTTEECDNIKFISATSKPEFASFLAGIKKVVITQKPKINGHIPAFSALYEYLQAMGFTSIQYLDENYSPPTNLCEEAMVSIGFDYQPMIAFYNITWTWTSPCNGYSWTLYSDKKANDGSYADPKYNFGKVLREMHGYKKGDFNSYYRIELPKRQTCWTESMFKNFVQSKGCDKIEGIYENSLSSETMAKYRVAVRKINGTYYLIYLSGANNYGNWTEGEIKGTLEGTATPLFYKCKWVMANKKENEDYYVIFENGLMNVVNDKDKLLFIKLFPSATANISTPSDIPASGTGFAISSNGYIVTNHHVINGSSSIKVRGVNGDFSKSYNAIVIIEDKNNDLSIIKIDDPNFSSLGTIPYIIPSKSCDVGYSIFCLGFPLRASMGDEVKLTNGIISSKSGFQGDITTYQITAPVQPGNSGGPLFDGKGNLVGIINSKHIGAENVSYAIKASYLLNLIDNMTNPPKLQTVSVLAGKSLTEQVKVVKIFTYIIEVN